MDEGTQSFLPPTYLKQNQNSRSKPSSLSLSHTHTHTFSQPLYIRLPAVLTLVLGHPLACYKMASDTAPLEGHM